MSVIISKPIILINDESITNLDDEPETNIYLYYNELSKDNKEMLIKFGIIQR
jgi:hypothetical protein